MPPSYDLNKQTTHTIMMNYVAFHRELLLYMDILDKTSNIIMVQIRECNIITLDKNIRLFYNKQTTRYTIMKSLENFGSVKSTCNENFKCCVYIKRDTYKKISNL